ncbi:family 20 glycosylhydrolase [Arcanobacterium canis]
MSIPPAGSIPWVSLPYPKFEPAGGVCLLRADIASVGTADVDEAREPAVYVTSSTTKTHREVSRLHDELRACGVRVVDTAAESDVTILLDLVSPDLSMEQDNRESVRIEVNLNQIRISGLTPTALFRGTRLVLHNVHAQGALPCGVATTQPQVLVRGLHVDAARKFYSSQWIEKRLYEMSWVGLNTFEWHFSENEGFRIESETFSQVVSAEYISREEVVRLLDLADDLHIDIIPSLDMPGHLRQVLAHFPNLQLPPAQLTPQSEPLAIPDTGHALDISHPEAVEFAMSLIDDFAPLFARCHRWNLGGDEFVDFARINNYPCLADAARERFGENANGFDLLTDFINQIAAHLIKLGFEPLVWNDGQLRGHVVKLDPRVTLTWWTNWHKDMAPLRTAIDGGYRIINFNDSLFYYVLGENAGYLHPTAQKIWDANWHPGLFPHLPPAAVSEEMAFEYSEPTRQELLTYPKELLGSMYSIWSDKADAETANDVAQLALPGIQAMAERAWNGGSTLSLDEFTAFTHQIGTPLPPPRH